jgi:hypothetical protein
MAAVDSQKKRDRIMDLVDHETGEMTPQEAIEFLEELSADIDGRIEALKEENDMGEEDDDQ